VYPHYCEHVNMSATYVLFSYNQAPHTRIRYWLLRYWCHSVVSATAATYAAALLSLNRRRYSSYSHTAALTTLPRLTAAVAVGVAAIHVQGNHCECAHSNRVLVPGRPTMSQLLVHKLAQAEPRSCSQTAAAVWPFAAAAAGK
jgi:hypothetical protein